jgi:hypothetical protein
MCCQCRAIQQQHVSVFVDGPALTMLLIGGQGLHPGALGPAAGRMSVYEQRAKLLFELGRAQARAAAVSGSAAQVRPTAARAFLEGTPVSWLANGMIGL